MNQPSSIARVEGRTIVGIGLMLSAIGLFTGLNGAVKWLTQSHDPLMVAWARQLGAFIFMLIIFLPRFGVNLFRPINWGHQIARGMYLVASTVLYFFGLSHLDMASGAAIQLTGPLMVTALSVPLLGEKVGWRTWAAVIVGFIGALIVIRPGIDMRFASLFFVASAMCSTIYQISTRYLAGRDDPAVAATIAALVGAIALTPVAPFVWSPPENYLNIALLLAVGPLAGIGHYLLTKAYRFAGASTLAPFGYTHLIGATIVGFVVFGNFPDHWTLIGASVIVGAGLYVAHRESVRARRNALSKSDGSS